MTGSDPRAPDTAAADRLPEIASLDAIAEMGGVPVSVVMDEVFAGRLAAREVGGVWLAHRRAVMVWLGSLQAELRAAQDEESRRGGGKEGSRR